ncbi:MAG: phosphoribosyltransferase, partial [Parachlamydiaceae bacterium]|nr:phosphoribosyltransferase [Parachlamydiaceae bacterium]
MHVTPEAYYETAIKLAVMIHKSGFEFDQILCPVRGGAPIGDFLSRVFKKPLAIMFTSSYDDSTSQQTKLKISDNIMIDKTLGKKVLFVDDLAEGVTLNETLPVLKEKYPGTEFRTAVLWYKTCSVFKPDYHVQIVGDHTWIHQYFEKFSPHTLKDE